MSITHKPSEMVKREYQLQEPTAVAVEKYAAFSESTPDHIVNSLLKRVICRDVEFQRWHKQQTLAEKKDGQAAAEAAQV